MTTITIERARLEELLGEYWEIAFEESSGVAATGNRANRVLHEIRALFDVKQAEIARLKAESEERLQNCAALVAENERLRAAPATAPEQPRPFIPWSKEAEMLESWAAQPAPQPERKPMHEGEIQAAWLGQDLDEPIPYSFVLGIRSAERFNGIKETP